MAKKSKEEALGKDQLNCVLSGNVVKATPKELNLQSIIEELNEEYGFAFRGIAATLTRILGGTGCEFGLWVNEGMKKAAFCELLSLIFFKICDEKRHFMANTGEFYRRRSSSEPGRIEQLVLEYISKCVRSNNIENEVIGFVSWRSRVGRRNDYVR